MTTRILSLLLLPLLLLVACGEDRPDAQDDGTVSEREVDRRRALGSYEGADSLDREIARNALEREARESILAERLGLTPADSAIERQGRAILAGLQKAGKDDEITRIIGIFDGDTAAFFRHTVHPQLVRLSLSNIYETEVLDSGETRGRVHRALELLRAEGTMKDVASSLELDYRLDTLDPSVPIGAEEIARYGDEITSDPIIGLLEPLPEGQILNQVLEDLVGYRLVRLIERRGDLLIVEFVEAPRMTFDEWVQMRIGDPVAEAG